MEAVSRIEGVKCNVSGVSLKSQSWRCKVWGALSNGWKIKLRSASKETKMEGPRIGGRIWQRDQNDEERGEFSSGSGSGSGPSAGVGSVLR